MQKLHVSLQVETGHTAEMLLALLRELLERDRVTVVQGAAVRFAAPPAATYKRDAHKAKS